MNMKQSCKALICAIEGELDGRHCTEEQAAAILDHALPSLTEALALAEAERDRYKLAWMEFMDRTDWMQEKWQVPAKYLGQHRADVLTAMLNEARAALATQPAGGEPAAWECVHGGYLSLIYEKEGDPEHAVPLFRAAPPAAAHGDEAVRKDAERYRWLRDYHIGDDPESINLDRAKRKGLNAAIDAAMRAQAREELLFTDAILPGGLREGGDA